MLSDIAPTTPFEHVEIEIVVDDPARCPDENVLAELVQGLLSIDVSTQIEQHLDTCEACRRTVSAVGQSSYVASRRTRIDSGRAAEMASANALSTWSTPRQAPAIPSVGTILAGKYRVDGVIGQGGMGVVLAATHLALGKLVALKLMRPDLAVDALAAQRFVREARAASQLRSEHIARVIDLDTLDDGTPYIAMEYLEGEDLGAVLARRGTIPAHEAAIYIAQVCDAIAEAHASGIVHRDLKPANLFLTQRANTPCIKVLDFGVSKILAGGPLADEVAHTDTRALVGSPHYMAPEQLLSAKAVDPRTDIWALGCILFELVSGKSPFNTGEALAHVMASILRDHAPRLRVDTSIPPDFIAIVERCLQKDPAQRFQRVQDLAAALAPFASRSVDTVPRAPSALRAAPMSSALRAPATSNAQAPQTTQPAHAEPRRASTTQSTRSRSSHSIAIAIVTALILVACTLFAIEHYADDNSDAAPWNAAPSAAPSNASHSIASPSDTHVAPAVSLPTTALPMAPPATAPTTTAPTTTAPTSTAPTSTAPTSTAPTSTAPTSSKRAHGKPASRRPTRATPSKFEADLIGPSFE